MVICYNNDRKLRQTIQKIWRIPLITNKAEVENWVWYPGEMVPCSSCVVCTLEEFIWGRAWGLRADSLRTQSWGPGKTKAVTFTGQSPEVERAAQRENSRGSPSCIYLNNDLHVYDRNLLRAKERPSKRMRGTVPNTQSVPTTQTRKTNSRGIVWSA